MGHLIMDWLEEERRDQGSWSKGEIDLYFVREKKQYISCLELLLHFLNS